MADFPVALFVLTTFILQCVLVYFFVRQRNRLESLINQINGNKQRIHNLVKEYTTANQNRRETNDIQDSKIKALDDYVQTEQYLF